jgi:hypothetical protein
VCFHGATFISSEEIQKEMQCNFYFGGFLNEQVYAKAKIQQVENIESNDNK